MCVWLIYFYLLASETARHYKVAAQTIANQFSGHWSICKMLLKLEDFPVCGLVRLAPIWPDYWRCLAAEVSLIAAST